MVRTPRDAWCWCLFRDEVSKDLTLDGMAWLEVKLESSELSCPLGDVARGVGIVEDGPQWIGSHHHNLVGLEVVTEFRGRNENGIKELMRLRIPGLCLVKDLTDILDRFLDGPDSARRTGSFCLSWGLAGPQVAWCFFRPGPGRTLRSRAGCQIGGGRTSFSCRRVHGGPLREMLGPLSDQHHADHFGCRCKIKKQCLTWVRCDQYRQGGEVPLHLLEGTFCLFSPCEWTGPPHQLEEGECLLRQPRNDAAEGCKGPR
jgi:hypothetical protein